jgi:transposase
LELHVGRQHGADARAAGLSKDNRPDVNQKIVGAALDEQGRPVICELVPGKVTDVRLVFPAFNSLQGRFEASSFCVVADRGMISQATRQAL